MEKKHSREQQHDVEETSREDIVSAANGPVQSISIPKHGLDIVAGKYVQTLTSACQQAMTSSRCQNLSEEDQDTYIKEHDRHRHSIYNEDHPLKDSLHLLLPVSADRADVLSVRSDISHQVLYEESGESKTSTTTTNSSNLGSDAGTDRHRHSIVNEDHPPKDSLHLLFPVDRADVLSTRSDISHQILYEESGESKTSATTTISNLGSDAGSDRASFEQKNATDFNVNEKSVSTSSTRSTKLNPSFWREGLVLQKPAPFTAYCTPEDYSAVPMSFRLPRRHGESMLKPGRRERESEQVKKAGTNKGYPPPRMGDHELLTFSSHVLNRYYTQQDAARLD